MIYIVKYGILEFDESGEVVYASVYMNPSTEETFSSTVKKALICHEIGHALGLEHPASASTKSIMSDDVYNSGFRTSIQTYDKNDISDIY